MLKGDGYKLFLEDGCRIFGDDEICDEEIVGEQTLVISTCPPSVPASGLASTNQGNSRESRDEDTTSSSPCSSNENSE